MNLMSHNKTKEYQELTSYLENQITLGLKPKWMVTLHYQSPYEHGRMVRETNKPLGFQDRFSVKTYGNIWSGSITDNYWLRRRNSLDLVMKDAGQLKNPILKELYGIKRIDRPDKYPHPHLFFFHEKGKLGLQYHTHILLPDEDIVLDTKEEIEGFFDGKMRDSRKCISRWKKVDVAPVSSAQGLMHYLSKETSRSSIALDFINSNPIIPLTTNDSAGLV